jgi:hypothetical protein
MIAGGFKLVADPSLESVFRDFCRSQSHGDCLETKIVFPSGGSLNDCGKLFFSKLSTVSQCVFKFLNLAPAEPLESLDLYCEIHTCFFCFLPLKDDKKELVCQFTGQLMGLCHSNCIDYYKPQKFILPFFFHNFKVYILILNLRAMIAVLFSKTLRSL